jgi:hypothetical protein
VFSPLFIKENATFALQSCLRLRLSRRGGLIFFKEDFFMTNKKFYLVGMAVLLSVSLFVIGCPTEAADGGMGPQGGVGSTGTTYLSGNQTTAGINHAIASGAPLVFAGVAQSDVGEVTIPAGRRVELVGVDAYKTFAGGTLIVAAASSVTGSGTLVANGAGGVVIAPDSVSTTAVSSGAVVNLQDGSGTITTAATFAVQGPITISGEATSGSNILNTALTSQTLYVIGNVTASAAINGASTIHVLGNVTVNTVDQTAAVVWDIKGNLDAKKLPTTGAGTLTVGGNADFAAAVSGITGAVSITGNATFEDALTTGAGAVTVGGILVGSGKTTTLGGALTVGGTAAFGGPLTNTAAVVATFNGATTVTGIVTTGSTGLTIAGTGAVTLAEVPVTATGGLTVKSTGGVTLTPATAIAANIVATKAVIKGTAGAGTLIKSDGVALTVGTGNSVAVTGEGASIVAGGVTGSVTIAGATLNPGTYTATNAATATLTLAASTEIAVANAVTIGTAGQIVFTDDSSKISLLAGGSLVASSAAGGLIKTGGDATGVTLTVGTTAVPGTATYATVGASSPFVVTTAVSAGTGSPAVVVGAVSWTVDKTDEVDAQAGAAAGGGAAIGTLTAGTGTTLTIAGTS